MIRPPAVEPAHLPGHLTAFLNARTGSSRASAQFLDDVREVLNNPLVRKACASPAFRDILARRREFTTMGALEAEIVSKTFHFGLGWGEIARATALFLPWERHRRTLQGLVAEYARNSGFPEGMSAVEVGLALAAGPQGSSPYPPAEAPTQAVFAGVRALVGSRRS